MQHAVRMHMHEGHATCSMQCACIRMKAMSHAACSAHAYACRSCLTRHACICMQVMSQLTAALARCPKLHVLSMNNCCHAIGAMRLLVSGLAHLTGLEEARLKQNTMDVQVSAQGTRSQLLCVRARPHFFHIGRI